jgi:prophage regulatory protein
MVRKAMRRPAVLAATGWSNSVLYDNIAKGKFPKPARLDPDGRSVVWWEDEVEVFQKAADDRRAFDRYTVGCTAPRKSAAA